jgi:hypothetical protein
MKTRTALASLAWLLAGVAMGAALDAHMGTWKLNESRSKFAAGATKNHTVIYTAVEDGLKVTVDGTTSDGKPVHNEWTGKVDGKDYPVTGGVTEETRSYKEIDSRTLEFVGKSGGKVTVTGRVRISADGKTRTVTTTGTDASGKKTRGTALYDKQ